jgi:hypothetical protein
VLLKFKQIEVVWVTVVEIMAMKGLDLVVQVPMPQLGIAAIGVKELQLRLVLPVEETAGMLVLDIDNNKKPPNCFGGKIV